MRFFSIFVATVASLLAPLVSAQSNGPLAITAPLGGSFQAGSQVTISWTPTTASTVTLTLRYGTNSGDLATGAPIASNADDNGSFVWTIPKDIASTTYSIQITGSDGVINYSPPFTVVGGTGQIPASISSSSAPTSTAKTSSTDKSSSTSASSSSSSGSSSASKSASSTSSSSATSTASSSAVPHSGASRAVKGGSIAAVFGLGALVAMA